ncbi:hypothetical protein TNCV_4982401 [Trichonephila clavipes]|nr:hypothetical protein TNCV_4982401 [Trichonephila clavipes]
MLMLWKIRCGLESKVEKFAGRGKLSIKHTESVPRLDTIGNVIEGVVYLAKQINLEAHRDAIQELLDFHNQELTIDELLEMHGQEQTFKNLRISIQLNQRSNNGWGFDKRLQFTNK